MRKLGLIITGMFAFATGIQAQTTTDNAATIKHKDSIIWAETVNPAYQSGNADWAAISSSITSKYGAYYADRMVTKGKIYASYGKDWPAFTAAIVHYTDTYEMVDNKDNLKLLNTNAKMILDHSSDKKELASAARWSKYTMEKDPNNETYKATYNALTAKINASK